MSKYICIYTLSLRVGQIGGMSQGLEFEFDPAKDASNIARHSLSLADFRGFDTPPVVVEDIRFDYGEVRLIALGRIGGVAHAVVYTQRGKTTRLISLRRAHEKELRRHE